MFTAHSSTDEIVLKSVALRSALRIPLPNTPTASTDTHSAHWQSAARAAVAPSQLQPSAPSTPSFTFHVPLLTSSTGPYAPAATVDGASFNAPPTTAAQSALRAALQRHEDALRAWANEPLHDVSAAAASALPSPGASALRKETAGGSAALGSLASTQPRLVRHVGVDSTAAARREGNRGTESAHQPSEVAMLLITPYSRVRAQKSVAGIGVPLRHEATSTSVAEGTDKRHRTTSHVTALLSLNTASEGGKECDAAASAASSSSSSSSSFTSQASLPLSASASRASSTAGASLLPYQVPLHLRWSSPSPQPESPQYFLSSEVTAGSSAKLPSMPNDRQAFLAAQAQRYAQWRQRQATVLQQLAPDMWGRAMPAYAALDGVPQVMDGGLRNSASTVRRSRYDSGVVHL